MGDTADRTVMFRQSEVERRTDVRTAQTHRYRGEREPVAASAIFRFVEQSDGLGSSVTEGPYTSLKYCVMHEKWRNAIIFVVQIL